MCNSYISFDSHMQPEEKKAAQKLAPVTPAPDKPAEPVYAHVEQFVDAQGRLHLRTAGPMASQAANP